MKLDIVVVLFVLIGLTACSGKTTTEQQSEPESSAHEWTEKDQQVFTKNCVGLLEIEGVDNAEDYCSCLLETSMREYPDPEEAMELEQSHIVEMFENSECIDDLLIVKIEDPWTEEAEALFVKECLTAQTAQGIDENTASGYCDCALNEIREIIPNPQHVISMTQEEMQHIIDTCSGKDDSE